MRVAALYDVHANFPALQATLQEVRKAGVDQIVIGGDVVPGPMPQETLSLLLNLDIPVRFIQGNGDREVVATARGLETVSLPEKAREVLRWTAQQLQPEHLAVLASWVKTLRINIPGIGDVLFCHATPRNDTDVFTRITAEERLSSAFAGVDANLAVCGHTHMQFDRKIGEMRVVNAGSVGMPFGNPGAYWLMLDRNVEFRRTDYDLVQAANAIRGTEYPQAEEFALRNVLQPPSEQEMLEAFSRVEVN